jgi:phosphopantothenoylcysteine decarboxylase/phosphopantothenate--cysteine ligase
MNDRMYEDAATQRNLELLRDRGVRVIEPEAGSLASRGEHGVGRLPAPESLLGEIEGLLPAAPGPWDGLRVLVTAGGTREPIDAVRYVGNRSSGRMGFALADRAARRGAEVTLIAANVALPTPNRVRRVEVSTAAELSEAVRREFGDSHLLLMVAAVADFRPARAESGKIAREESGSLELRLEPTDDVLAAVGAERRDDQVVVAFAAEHGGNAIARAREKLRRKGADAIVVNDVSRDEIGFDSDLNEVVVVDAEREHAVPLGPKEEVADAILDRVENQFGGLPVGSRSRA